MCWRASKVTEARTASAVVIVGCGDVGRRVARRLSAAGRPVLGIVRNEASALALQRTGIAATALDLDDTADAAELVQALQAQQWRDAELHWYVPPPSTGTDDPRLRRVLDALHRPHRLLLLSTSAVYGDCGGAWIDEDAPLRPASDRARRRADAEHAARDWAGRRGAARLVVRVAGIYGPGRLPIERLRSGAPVLAAAESPYSNRIHVDDLATTLLAAAARGRDGAVYHAADGHPTTMTDYFLRCAEALGLPPPAQLTMDQARAQLSHGLLSYLEESRRLCNRRLREELRVTLRYPTLAQGLPASIAGG